jgi:Spy/CpxP family protein refolding chaperone
MKLPITILSLALAGTLMAQKTPSPQAVPEQSSGHSAQHSTAVDRTDRMVQRLTRRLNLTPDQQTRVRDILMDSKSQAKPLASQVKEERMELKAAIRSDSESKIDQITRQNAQLNAQMEAAHAKAMAKIYAALTPDQKAKFDRMGSNRVTHVRRASRAHAHSAS